MVMALRHLTRLPLTDATAAHCWLNVARRCATDSSGFTYQAQAVHRCLAAGLLECPQYTKAESICVTGILDGIATALEAQPAFPPAPTPVFDGRKQHDELVRALAICCPSRVTVLWAGCWMLLGWTACPCWILTRAVVFVVVAELPKAPSADLLPREPSADTLPKEPSAAQEEVPRGVHFLV